MISTFLVALPLAALFPWAAIGAQGASIPRVTRFQLASGSFNTAERTVTARLLPRRPNLRLCHSTMPIATLWQRCSSSHIHHLNKVEEPARHSNSRIPRIGEQLRNQ